LKEQLMLDQKALFEKFVNYLQTEPLATDYLGEEPTVVPPFDPYQMVAEWIALRHEVKQQGKLWQATQGTLQQALVEIQSQREAEAKPLVQNDNASLGQAEKDQKALLRDLLGILDALGRACDHGQAQIDRLEQSSLPSRSFGERWLRSWFPSVRKKRKDLPLSPSWRDTLMSNQEGIALIQRSLLDILRQRQVVPIAAEGCPFDSQTMYALGREENGAVPENTVLQEVVPGYLWKGQILRESQVIVSVRKL
jgi:molecular chaperone GrpE